MIGVVDVEINAANPHVPLRPVRTYVGSPQSFRVRNVPRRIGEWEIKAVRLWVFYPDSTTETANCVLTGGVWVGTVGASAVPGTSVAGFVVNADGIDEFGQPVVGYILGVGDVEVLTREQSVTPGVITFKGDKGDKGDPGEKGEKGDPGEGAVNSVNGKVGAVVLGAHDVDAYTQSETDDKITRFVAHYLTDKVGGRFVPFATHAALADAKAHHGEANPRFFYAGQGFTPTKNDYCVILADETVEGKTTRYSFVGDWPTGSFQYQYTINDTAFSEAQWAAINSGVTEEWMASTLSAATTALNNAEAAQYTADQALSDAADAMGSASTAQTEARDAKDIADNAQSLAGDAASRAEDAWTAADEARVSAGGAQNTADEAQSAANDAQSTADEANARLDSLTTTDIDGLTDALAAKESVCLPSSSVTTITSGSIVDITLASGAVNVTFAAAVGNALRYCELIVRGVTADGGVTINLPSGMDALYAEGVASRAGINHYIFAEYSRGHWLVSRMTRTTTIG